MKLLRDYVIIQFGHNDSGALNDATLARGSLPGLGEETQEIDNQLTKQHETIHTFGWYMRKMIADAKAKGASPPILFSLTVLRYSGRMATWNAALAIMAS